MLPDTAKEETPKRRSNRRRLRQAAGQRRAGAAGGQGGDRVIFAKYGGTEVKVNGDEYLILRENDILTIAES